MRITSDRKKILKKYYGGTNFRWHGIITENLKEMKRAITEKSPAQNL